MTPAAINRVRVRVDALGFGQAVQVAFHAPSLDEAAAHWSRHGAGPFYLLEHVALTSCFYRGAPAAFDHSSAYGQMGGIMLELIHQHDDRPSAVRDMYDAMTPGPHHAAIFVDDIDIAVSEATERGYAIALDAASTAGVRFVMADARAACGVMLELYEPSDALTKFYGFIRRKSAGWAGDEPLRKLSEHKTRADGHFVRPLTMPVELGRRSQSAGAVALSAERREAGITKSIGISI